MRNPPTDFRLLNPAVSPKWPQKSRRRLVAAVCTLLGFLVSVAYVLLSPLLDRRAHTAREAAFWSGLPVVGSSNWPDVRDPRNAFAAELYDHAVHSRGTTLVVATSPSDVPYAHELAYRLGPAVETKSPASLPAEAGPSNPPNAGASRSVATSTSDADTTRDSFEPSRYPLAKLPGSGDALVKISHDMPVFLPWNGVIEGQALRRAVRLADRVLVLVRSGQEPLGRLWTLRSRMGRNEGVALALVGLPDELMELPDRVGDYQAFWSHSPA